MYRSSEQKGYPPKFIWMLWLQGWQNAPSIVKASQNSWIINNPTWKLHALDFSSLNCFLPKKDVNRIFGFRKPLEALSDQIRLELLHRYGGVWADSTTICAHPLDSWLPQAMPQGFFAFAQPTNQRLLSTWFLAAEKGNPLIQRWHHAAHEYWRDRQERDHYFWVHILIENLYANDRFVRDIWDGTPKMKAQNPFHFSPESKLLQEPPTAEYKSLLADPCIPVFKLTHKFRQPPGENSLFARILKRAENRNGKYELYKRKKCGRILVGCYGSFEGHGTVGDHLALVSVVSHLVGLGYEVCYASVEPLTIVGAKQVDWRHVHPDSVDIVIFSCGPILRSHEKIRKFLEHFAKCILIGIGVSLLPKDDPNHWNPFQFVLARQGLTQSFGDVAIVAPMVQPINLSSSVSLAKSSTSFRIGLALRGHQEEYGIDRCEADLVGNLFSELTSLIGRYKKLTIVDLDHRLAILGANPEDIEKRYRECDLILTTRYHGAILALRAATPFIAVDQITGGGKVLPLLQSIGASTVYRVDTLDPLALIRTCLELLQDDQHTALLMVTQSAVHQANITLDSLGDVLMRQLP